MTKEHKYKTGKICFGKSCFEVEIARTLMEKARGLSFRKSLLENSGMFFAFWFQWRHAFWMKNTLMPLDIIWLDKNYIVVDIARDSKPCTGLLCPAIIPSKPAKYVLEINAGLSKKMSIEVGSKAEFAPITI